MFSRKLLMLPMFIVCTSGLECDGTGNSERITTRPLKYIYLRPGNQANLVWTWCIAVNSSFTGIVIFRSSPRNPKQISPVLTMDLSKNVYYQKDKSTHELSSILNETKFQEKTVFILNNVSKADSGTYILCVRREGSRDLQSEVQVIVKTTDSTNEQRLTSPMTERTTVSFNNTILERKGEGVVHSNPWYMILGIVLSTLFVASVVFATVFIITKRKKCGDRARKSKYSSTKESKKKVRV